jgi:lipopolysaccharide/colanic/teichoic acid biosynthesis glycosyltransferase
VRPMFMTTFFASLAVPRTGWTAARARWSTDRSTDLQLRRKRGSRRRVPTRGHIVASDLFPGVLVREQKRADRSGRPVVLVLVTLDAQGSDAAAGLWMPAVQSLLEATRETDVIGWVEEGAVLGVVLPDFTDASGAASRQVKARIRRALARRVDARTLARVGIELHVYAHPKSAAAGVWSHEAGLLQAAHQRQRRTLRDAVKRAVDLAGSAALLTVLAPLFALIAAAIKLKSSGPVFFRQERIGRGAVPFTCLKFRTMSVDADHRLHTEYMTNFIKRSGQTGKPDEGTIFKMSGDPRVTPIGRLLRKTSLDELPQLWNVLRGEMSLVGPRPPIAYEIEQYEPWHWQRVMAAKPGITGLWQVAGRSRTTFDGMVRLDLRYAKTRSLWTDIKILLATPAAVISGKGAC